MIFIANTLALNGGTTFLIRITKAYLKRHNRKPAVLVLFRLTESNLERELAKTADVMYLDDYLFPSPFRHLRFKQLLTFFPLKWPKLASDLSRYGTHIHIMGIFGLIFAKRFASKCAIKVSVGVYHKNEYLFKCKRHALVRHLRDLLTSLPPQNFVFYNDEIRRVYSIELKKSFNKTNVLTFGINLPPDDECLSPSAFRRRLVSVGNLVSFKTYNAHTINALRYVSGQFPEVNYDIYGEGPMLLDLQQLVKSNGLQERVSFKGSFPYSQFPEVLKSCTLFIGSGTSALEAAALGIPTLVGVDGLQTPESHGFLSEIAGHSINEYRQGAPSYGYGEKIEFTLSLSSEELSKLGKNCRKKAQEFSLEKAIEDFDRLENLMRYLPFERFVFKGIALATLFIYTGILDALGLDRSFRLRRDHV